MKNSLLSFIAVMLFLVSFSTAARGETFFAYLNGAQEVPPVSTSATGYARVFVNESTMTLTFTVVFNNLGSNQTASHIHAPAPIGANAGVVIDFGAVGGTSGTITGTRTITATQLAQLRQNQGYVNVHTQGFGSGEIRGQLGKKRPVDFDGDGRQDYSVLRFPNVAPPGVSPIRYYNLNSTTGVQIGDWGNANTDFPAPGDYDGDGRDDLAIYRTGPTTGSQNDYWILRSSDSTVQHFAWGVRGDLTVARDYDGDGITDAAVFRRGAVSTAQTVWYIRRSSTGAAQVVPWGLTGNGTTSTDAAIPGDYDGDGKFDIAVYRFGNSPNNSFIILRSSDGLAEYKPFGNFATDWVVPGDYDGDGKYDLTVARTGTTGSSPMVWWIQDSSTNIVRAVPFGLSSDTPAQGDYDGDARADIAIYRPGATAGAQSFFWVRRSFDLTTQTVAWGLGADFAVNTFDAR